MKTIHLTDRTRDSKGHFVKETRVRTHRTCTVCEIVKPIDEYSVSSKGAVRCRCKMCEINKSHAHKRTLGGQFSDSKAIAKRRGILFSIPRKDYYALRAQSCHYCGFPLAPTGVGLDRLDSSLGYTLDNVVPCCDDCNRCKGAAFTYAEMLYVGKAIAAVKACRQEGEKRNHYKPRLKQETVSEPAPVLFFGMPIEEVG
jgi:hypothetical protein